MILTPIILFSKLGFVPAIDHIITIMLILITIILISKLGFFCVINHFVTKVSIR